MDFLPISSISELDSEFNLEIINLAKLKRGGLPILDGLVISIPKEIIDKINNILNQDKSRSKINLAQNQFKNISIPQNPKSQLNQHKHLFLNQKIDAKNIWRELLNNWWNEFLLKYRKFQPEYDNKIKLDQKIVFFLDSKNNLFKKAPKIQNIKTNFDEILEDFVIESEIHIHPELLSEIDQTVKLAHKFLTLPHNFEIIIYNNQPFIISIKPYTAPLLSKKLENRSAKISAKNLPSSAVKAYFNLPKSSLKTFVANIQSENFDNFNCILNGEDFPDFESRVKIIDYLNQSFPNSNIIFKFPDILENNISGSLRLLNQPKLLKDSCEFVLFLRNKKNIGNLDIAIPHVRSVEELFNIKRELLSYGISQKNGMRTWLEIMTPENLINIDKYLESDLGGLIINLDNIEKLLVGFKIQEEQNQTLAVEVILELLFKVFKSAHKLNTPIIIKGQNYITAGLLETFISWGVYGVVVNSLIEAESLPYYLALLEKKLINSQLPLSN